LRSLLHQPISEDLPPSLTQLALWICHLLVLSWHTVALPLWLVGSGFFFFCSGGFRFRIALLEPGEHFGALLVLRIVRYER